MEKPEVIFNLWYVSDENGVISSMRAKAYISDRTDDEMASFLKASSPIDYESAEVFPVPEKFLRREIGFGKRPMTETRLKGMENPMALFEDAIKKLASDVFAQTGIRAGDPPERAYMDGLIVGEDENFL